MRNDGGQAFSSNYREWLRDDGGIGSEGTKGMTLRDYLAAKAMQGMMAMDGEANKLQGETWQSATARVAYEVADQMLERREKP